MAVWLTMLIRLTAALITLDIINYVLLTYLSLSVGLEMKIMWSQTRV